jgi:hypothetical protein
MDSAVTELLGAEENCTYFQDTDFTELHFGSGEDLIEYIRSVYQTHGKDTKMMTLPISMIKYFTRFRDDILQCAKLTRFEDITVKHLLSFMCKKGYKNGISLMSDEERKVASEKGYKNGIGAMSAEERMAARKKGSSNNKMGIAWERKFVEFKRCLEMPERGTPLYNWQAYQLRNTQVDCLNAKIRKEIEENEGNTVWSKWRVKHSDCVEQMNRAKIGNTWERKFVEFKRCVEMPERGTPAKIRKEIEENKGSTEWSERRVKLSNCVAQKRRE